MNILSDDRVQIIVRTTVEEREKIKKIAKSKKKSMNQLIIDSVIDISKDSSDSTIDSSTDITIIEVFKAQLENKDKQIDKLQNLLDQQQQLSLQSNKQIEQLQLQLSNETEIDLENPNRNKVVNEKDSSEVNEKKSFFNRIFKK
uniref:DUF536 domain-containing protein n=1 Tax=Arthrobacter sp. TaxID=1667 RepID=UPI00215DB278|nr:DUF536 domain-containing protein [Arthrobacter sp.]